MEFIFNKKIPPAATTLGSRDFPSGKGGRGSFSLRLVKIENSKELFPSQKRGSLRGFTVDDNLFGKEMRRDNDDGEMSIRGNPGY